MRSGHAVQEPSATAQVRSVARRGQDLERDLRGVEPRDWRQEAPRTGQACLERGPQESHNTRAKASGQALDVAAIVRGPRRLEVVDSDGVLLRCRPGVRSQESLRAGVVKLADAPDSKSGGGHPPCGFNSHLRHHASLCEACLPDVGVRLSASALRARPASAIPTVPGFAIGRFAPSAPEAFEHPAPHSHCKACLPDVGVRLSASALRARPASAIPTSGTHP